MEADDKFYEAELVLRGGLKFKPNRFPWEMHIRPGSEEVKNWSLPAAANNPTFGLPDIPTNYPLPDTPYLFLKRYEKKDAAIFFGRGHYVRDLYRRLTNRSASPVIMLYGQSGVGKSSLLGAGLMPRLEKDFDIKYVRRDPSVGLTGGLTKALGELSQNNISPEKKEAERARVLNNIHQFENIVDSLAGEAKTDAQQIIEKYRAQLAALDQPQRMQTIDLANAWQSMEKNRPLIVILDQVEEVFTPSKCSAAQ